MHLAPAMPKVVYDVAADSADANIFGIEIWIMSNWLTRPRKKQPIIQYATGTRLCSHIYQQRKDASGGMQLYAIQPPVN